jgi:hypothetical protein
MWSKPDLKQNAADKSEREDAERQSDRGHGFAQGTVERIARSRGGNENAFVSNLEPLSANAQRFVLWTSSVNRSRPRMIFGQWLGQNEIVGSKRG